jgi:hypothetical protein
MIEQAAIDSIMSLVRTAEILARALGTSVEDAMRMLLASMNAMEAAQKAGGTDARVAADTLASSKAVH